MNVFDRPYLTNNIHSIINYQPQDQFKYVFAISEVNKKRYIIILRKYNELKFVCFPHKFIFHDEVGGAGTAELVSLYYFLRDLGSSLNNDLLNVYTIPEVHMNEILAGNIYPGIIEKHGKNGCIDILYDFLDIYQENYYSNNYCSQYGDSFVGCQNIIVSYLKKTNL